MLLGAMSIQLPRPRIGSDNSKETSRLIDETGLRGTTVLLTTDRDASMDVAYRGEHQKIGEAEGHHESRLQRVPGGLDHIAGRSTTLPGSRNCGTSSSRRTTTSSSTRATA